MNRNGFQPKGAVLQLGVCGLTAFFMSSAAYAVQVEARMPTRLSSPPIEAVVMAPEIASNGGGEVARLSVYEGQYAVTQIQIARPDAQLVQYRLLPQNDAPAFQLNPFSGELRFRQAAPYRGRHGDNQYQVTVVALDAEGRQDQQTLHLRVVRDSDGDGVDDYTDLDLDNDGLPNRLEGEGDLDGDGIADIADLDADGDGQFDLEQIGLDNPRLDRDGDGRIDVWVPVGVNGIADVLEFGADTGRLAWQPSWRGQLLDAHLAAMAEAVPNVPENRQPSAPVSNLLSAAAPPANTATPKVPEPVVAKVETAPEPVVAPEPPQAIEPEKRAASAVSVPVVEEPVAATEKMPLQSAQHGPNWDGPHPPVVSPRAPLHIAAPVLAQTPPTSIEAEPQRVALAPAPPRDNPHPALLSPEQLDWDGDGLSNALEGMADFDRDGLPNHLDLDSDNDKLPDLYEALASAPEVSRLDRDGDGRLDASQRRQLLSRVHDQDLDGQPDFLDLDSDGDGIGDINEYPLVESAAQWQLRWDMDRDHIPNHRDLDADGDGLPDVLEAGLKDSNGDGLVDEALDESHYLLAILPDQDSDRLPDAFDLDADQDGISDVREQAWADENRDGRLDMTVDFNGDGYHDYHSHAPLALRDSDQDRIPNHLDSDSDNDGLLDVWELFGEDQGGDGRVDVLADADRNGLPDSVDAQVLNGPDRDADGIDDRFDADVNGDGRIDVGRADADGDGISDFGDADADGDGWVDAPALARVRKDRMAYREALARVTDPDSVRFGPQAQMMGGGLGLLALLSGGLWWRRHRAEQRAASAETDERDYDYDD